MLDLKTYIDSEKIETLIPILEEDLKTFDWRKYKSFLIEQEKDISESNLLWYALTVKGDQRVFESNNEAPNIIEDQSLDGAEYLLLNLTHLNGFEKIKKYILGLKGVDCFGIHFIGPGTTIPVHTDDDVNSILITHQIKEYDLENTFLTINDTRYSFNKNEIFLFDGDAPHSATNFSDQDWIVVSIRIKKEFFK